jgi:hypothetical protein
MGLVSGIEISSDLADRSMHGSYFVSGVKDLGRNPYPEVPRFVFHDSG